MSDIQMEAARARMLMRGPDDIQLTQEGQINDHPDQRAEYPRMLYRMTDKEDRQIQTDAQSKCGETWLVTNDFGTPTEPLLCETQVANSPDDAELMAADGWDISPRAAHGLSSGIVTATTAKDDEIARLRAELAARDEMAGVEPMKGTLKAKAA